MISLIKNIGEYYLEDREKDTKQRISSCESQEAFRHSIGHNQQNMSPNQIDTEIRGYGDTAIDDDLLFDSTVTHPSSSVILFYMTLILIVEMGGTLNNYRVYSPIYI